MADPASGHAAGVEKLTNAVWVLAALAAAGRADRIGRADRGDRIGRADRGHRVGEQVAPLGEELGAVLGAAGYAELTSDGWVLLPAYRRLGRASDFPRQVAGILRQAAEVAEGNGPERHAPGEYGPEGSGPDGPGKKGEAALLADGAVSGVQAAEFLRELEARFPAFRELLGGPDVRFLDVGVGVGGITEAVLRRSPDCSAVGLDVDRRMLGLAAEYLAQRGVAARSELRQQDVTTLTERERYDLAWLPLVALAPEDAVAALPRVRTALRPGGWLLTATALPAGTEKTGEAGGAGEAGETEETGAGSPALREPIVRWRLALRGVTCWDTAELAERLTADGYQHVHVLHPDRRAMPLVVARAPA